MKLLSIKIVCVILVLAHTNQVEAQNLITNSSCTGTAIFSTLPTGWVNATPSPDTNDPGVNTLALIGAPFVFPFIAGLAASPDGGTALGGSTTFNGGESFSQTGLAVTAGRRYTVSFYQANPGISGFSIDNGSGFWQVSGVPTVAMNSPVMAGPTAGVPMVWTQVNLTFTASSSTTLTFTPVGATVTSGYLEIDGITLVEATPLPIDLVDFTATPSCDQKVTLQWQTASESNNDYFTVERSSNNRDWEVVERIPGAGNSTVSQTYKTVDEQPLLGVSYYRLTQTDFDGRFTHSPVVSSLLECDISSISIAPNPAKNNITISSKEKLTAPILIRDVSGKNVSNLWIPLHKSEYSHRIDVSQLSSGIYTVQVGNAVSKLIKQ